MKTVTLILTGLIRKEIRLELEGVPIRQPDGSTRIQIGPNSERVPFGFRCLPPTALTDGSIKRIVDAVSFGIVIGEVDEGEWRLHD